MGRSTQRAERLARRRTGADVTLFIGGPEDGKDRHVPECANVYRVVVREDCRTYYAPPDYPVIDPPHPIQQFEYWRFKLLWGVDVFAVAGTSGEDVIKRLVAAYPRSK